MDQQGNESTGHPVKVLCTLRFTEEQLDKLRAVSPRLIVEQRTCHNATEVREALTEDIEVLYAFHLPADLLSRAPKLQWVQKRDIDVGEKVPLQNPPWTMSL